MVKRLVAGVMLVSTVAFAQARPTRAEQPQPYQRVTEVGFDGELIEADASKPDVEYLDTQGRARHPSLVRIREHFRDEALGSVSGF
jgi:hypothetical protein